MGNTINAVGLSDKIIDLLNSSALDSQFALIKEEAKKSTATFDAANAPVNVRKNRYSNVKPIDATRVKLASRGEPGGDYINANYVDGWRRPRAFIATQGPVPQTIPDFWRMVWEEKSGVIVMVTREMEGGRLKCHQYWP